MSKKQKRIVFRVKPTPQFGCWEVTRNREHVQDFEGKKDAVRNARAWAREARVYGDLSQLVVHGRNGKIQYESTYGADPKKSKG